MIVRYLSALPFRPVRSPSTASCRRPHCGRGSCEGAPPRPVSTKVRAFGASQHPKTAGRSLGAMGGTRAVRPDAPVMAGSPPCAPSVMPLRKVVFATMTAARPEPEGSSDALPEKPRPDGITPLGGVLATTHGRIAAVLVSCALCLGAAPPASAELSCTDWNTPAFFKEATATDVTRCLAGGADQERRKDDMHRHMPKFQRWLFGLLVDPSYSKPHGNSSLHLAAMHSTSPSVIAALLDGGGNLETRDTYGSTPLHHAAAFSESPSMVVALLEAGADPEAETGAGETAWDLAKNNPSLRESAALRLLKDAGRE